MPGGGSVYSKANPAERTERAAIVFDLKLQGLSYRAIDALTQTPDGPTGGTRISPTTAKELVYEEAARRIDPRVESLRAIESERLAGSLVRLEASLARLDGLQAAAIEVLEREHITVNNGRIIVLNDQPLPDSGPALQAIAQLVRIEDTRRATEETRRRISESYRKLFGLDAPARTEVQITEVTQQDIELQELIREAKAKVNAEEAAIVEGDAP
ncbi:hypothetical protein [Streptomyces sp. NPDC002994]|uniref:hypothetical protein n=1 Tax=Streptomyces sp. NPDC002994 TaxID=3154441 RepID=UPI0033B60C45